MKDSSRRFLFAAFWPVTIWSSLTHLEEHPADDYVGLTSPIVATAIGFWICLACYVALNVTAARVAIIDVEGEQFLMAFVHRWRETSVAVLGLFLLFLYAIGLWLFTVRDERFPR